VVLIHSHFFFHTRLVCDQLSREIMGHRFRVISRGIYMSDSEEPLSDRENRLDEASASYYQAAEAGNPPKPAD
jgi:hypothetical protein